MSKILTTNKGGPRFQEIAYDRATPGPMAGAEISPFDFIARHATPEEIRKFEKIVRDRVAKEPREVWEICMKCGNVSSRGFRRAAGRPCFKCNFNGEVGGGFYRDMIPAEVKAFQERQAKKDAEERIRMERAEFEHDADDRRRRGLVPLTVDEFRARRKAEAEARAKERQEFLERERQELMNLARKLTKDLPR
jgi:hypothetical protein